MPRRQLRLVTSSDEEEEPPQQIQPEEEEDYIDEELQRSTFNFENVNLNSSNPIPNSSEPVPLDISDDEFIDVSDHLSSLSPPPPPLSTSTTFAESVSVPGEASECPITSFLSALSLRLRREWMDSCIRSLETAVPGFSRLDSAAKAKLCFEQFTHSDMNYTGAVLGSSAGKNNVDVISKNDMTPIVIVVPGLTSDSSAARAIVPIMGKNSTLSRVGAGGLMGKSGGAPKMPIQTLNTVSGTCTVAAIVQESLWNLNLLLRPCRLQCHT